MLQYKEDKNALRRYISDNEDFFGSISYEAANAAGTLLHSSKWFDKAISKFVNKEKEDCNMCKAIDDMIDEGRQEGRQEGICGAVSIMKSMNLSDEQMIQRLVDTYEMSDEEAGAYITRNIN